MSYNYSRGGSSSSGYGGYSSPSRSYGGSSSSSNSYGGSSSSSHSSGSSYGGSSSYGHNSGSDYGGSSSYGHSSGSGYGGSTSYGHSSGSGYGGSTSYGHSSGSDYGSSSSNSHSGGYTTPSSGYGSGSSSYGGRPTPPSSSGSSGYNGGTSSSSVNHSGGYTPPNNQSTGSNGNRPTYPGSTGSYTPPGGYTQPPRHSEPSTPTSSTDASSGRPQPPSSTGSSYGRPVPPSSSGASNGRPVPPSSSGSSNGRPVPPSSSGSSYGRPVPPSSSGYPSSPTRIRPPSVNSGSTSSGPYVPVPTRRPPPPVVDPYTRNVPSHDYQSQTNALVHGGRYGRDLNYDTHITNYTTIIVNNRNVNYYAPSYYNSLSTSYSTWGGGFWAGYTAGYIAGAIDQSYYDRWNAINIGEYYEFPRENWAPYYGEVLARPIFAQDIDYSAPAAWQTPPLNSNQDPLEQLASYGQLQKPGSFLFWTTHNSISAIEARDRLNRGEEVDVSGVKVHSWDELAAIVPEMVNGRQGALPAEAKQALQYTTARPTPGGNNVATMGLPALVDKLPSFAEVYSPKSVQAEDEVDGKKVNRTMDAAAAIYDRPEVRQAIATWWQQNPTADRDAINHQINTVVTKALVDDLTNNGAQYAQDPSFASNPVYYLKAGDAAYNQSAIDKVLTDGPPQLAKNLIVKENT